MKTFLDKVFLHKVFTSTRLGCDYKFMKPYIFSQVYKYSSQLRDAISKVYKYYKVYEDIFGQGIFAPGIHLYKIKMWLQVYEAIYILPYLYKYSSQLRDAISKIYKDTLGQGIHLYEIKIWL